MDNFHQSGKYSAQIDSHQAELRREEILRVKNHYLIHPYRLTIYIFTADQVVVKIVREKIFSR